jgi:hypothetical protein
MLRFLFRHVITDRSMAWMYDYRVEWDRPLTTGALSAAVPSNRAA